MGKEEEEVWEGGRGEERKMRDKEREREREERKREGGGRHQLESELK